MQTVFGAEMSVIKSKRSLSDLKFFHNALVLRRAIATLLLKDFGVKDKCRSVKLFEHLAKISEEDKKVIEPIFEKYNIVTISSEWPGWLLTKFRDSLYELSKNMMQYVVAANSVYQNSTAECIQRRELQNAAIYSCQQLLIEMQFVISILPVNAEKLQPFITMISEEIFLLKRWKKSDNKIIAKIKEKEKQEKL